ncbi:MAG: hypothetical protein OEZ06_08590 [Myxococcales bacterium]|nr:hypothetical protein [Myxococcales bacterium]
MRRRLAIGLLLSGHLHLLAGCLSYDGRGLPVSVELGIPDEETGLGFVPLMEGDEIPLETFGQGGTHATVAVRCKGFGDRAFVQVFVENLETGAVVMTIPYSSPPLLLCREELGGETCDLLPVHVLTGGLAAPEEKDGLAVRVTAVVENEEGWVSQGSVEGVLRMQ